MSPSATWALYGANGYTAQLIAAEALRRGHRPRLMGRTRERLAPVAERLGLDFKVASLDEPKALRRELEGVLVVLHAAGPFARTSRAMVQACLDVGASYLDLTGELEVFTEVFRSDAAARARKLALVPGVGFDVVATDVLAAEVAADLPNALELEVGVMSSGGLSRGTALTALLAAGAGGFVRRDGVLCPKPLGTGVRRLAFDASGRRRFALPVPLGDLETAFRHTRIPNITGYVAVPSRLGRVLEKSEPVVARASPRLLALFGLAAVRRPLERLVDRSVQGPDASTRERVGSFSFARVVTPSGRCAEAWLELPEAYEFTARSSVRAVEEILARRPVGALSPFQAFGPGFIHSIEGARLVGPASRGAERAAAASPGA